MWQVKEQGYLKRKQTKPLLEQYRKKFCQQFWKHSTITSTKPDGLNFPSWQSLASQELKLSIQTFQSEKDRKRTCTQVENYLARLVCNAPHRCPSQPLLKSLHWLPVISLNVFSTNSALWSTKFDYTSSHISCLFQHIGHYQPVRSLRSSNSLLLTVHLPRQLPQLELSASSLQAQLFRIVCHMQSEKRPRNPNLCVDWRDIFFNASLVDHGYPTPLYHHRSWLWIYGNVYKSSDWLID